MTESGGGARDNEQYAVDTGGSNTGDTYSYGAAGNAERALGGLQSGTLIPSIGACFTNNTGATITSLDVAYTGEQWRISNTAAARDDRMDFQYSTDATSLTTGTWTDVNALDFTNPIKTAATAGALDGNAAANRTAISSTISSLSIANGATFWIRWNDLNASGADDGLAVDDFSITPNGASLQPNLTINDVSLNEGNAGTTSFTFTASLSAPAGAGGVTFDIATVDGTAVAPGDYTTNSLTGQTIPAGSSTYSFTVLVIGDTTPETNETFVVNISNLTGANATDVSGQATIVNDDAAPNLTINDVSLNEGNAGTTTFTFTVNLSAPAPAGGVTFDIATANNTATQPSDYTANSLTSQTIPAGSSTYSFDVLVNGDTAFESNETFFVNITNITNAIGADAQGQGTIVNDDYTPIHDIQGPGASSPIVGTSVTTRGIVTGLKSNGFFIQDAEANYDADPATSEGIFVFTSGAPPVAAASGNLVQVTATVVEFVPSAEPQQPPLSELSSPTVTLVSSGNPLPSPIPLTATFPNPAGSYDQLERVEGMRVSMASMTVGGPTLGNVNEPNATATSTGVFYGTFTGVPRAFREPGVQAPDTVPAGSSIPPIPRFDTNPEVIRVDSDGLIGGPQVNVGTGALVTGLVGPLDYGFRHYTILPDPASPPMVTGGPIATAVTTPMGDEFTVASYNLERFFDTVADGNGAPTLTTTAFNNRLAKASLGIRDFLKAPDIVGIVEIENLTTLQALAAKISADAVAASQPDPQYSAFLVEGNDVGGIDVGFLVKTANVVGSTPRVLVNSVTQELDASLFTNPDTSTETLHDRPPLRLDATVNFASGATFPLQVIINHMRSLNDVSAETPGSNGWATDGARVRAKRLAQVVDLANLIQTRQTNSPTEHLVLLGDFNFFEFNDGYVDSMSTLLGAPVPDNETVVPGDGIDLVTPNLTLLLDAALQRYSFVFDGNAQSLDHAIINAPMITDTLARRVEHPRINADFPETARNGTTTVERLADHDPLVTYFKVAQIASADLAITKTDSPDPVTAGNNLTYTITVTNNGPDAASTASWSDTLPAGTTFVSLPTVAGWTCTTPAVGVGGTISCSNPSFAVGSDVFTLTVAVAPSVAAGTVLSNTATITSSTGDANSINNSATTTTTAAASANLSITKIDTPDPVTAGNNLTYTITVANAGPSNAASVSLSDMLPAGTTYVSLSSPGGWSCTTPAVGSNGTVSCSATTLAVGNAVFTLVVNAGTTGMLMNTATVSAVTSDPVPGNESATATTTVNCQTITVTNPATATGTAGAMFSQTFTQAGGIGTTTFSTVSTLPTGLTLSTAGLLSGTPTQTGTFAITMTATDSNGCVGTGATYTLVIGCQTITVTNPATTTGTAGTAFSQTFTQAGGIGATTFSTASTLPTGLTLSTAGVLSGTPTQTGTFSITVTATDSNGCAGTGVTYTLVIGCQSITVTNPATTTGTAGTAFSQTFTQSGGIGPTTFSTASTLPTGLTLSTAGVLSGTPTQTGTFPITVTATDSNGCVGTSATYTLVISPSSAFTPAPTMSLFDPLACAGPGDLVNGSFGVTNTSAVSQTGTVTVALPASIIGLPGTCTTNVGTCTVTATTVTWTGTLTANESMTASYQAQLANGVVQGSTACAITTAVFGANTGTVQACLTINCVQAGPGILPSGQNSISDQKPGSVLIYPIYSSSAANANSQNTRIAITNTNPSRTAIIHLFFVDGSSCSVADSYICLTPNQTASVLASDIDPGTTGYLVAVAVNSAGCPIDFNFLIGDEFVKLASGHQSNLGAESIAAIAGGLPVCNPLTDNNAVLAFNNVSYNALPRVLASSNIPSRGDGNDTYVVIDRIGGNLSTAGSTIGGFFGILYDDAEAAYSFSLAASACQSAGSITNDRPRVVPRFETVIPSGRSGWFKLWGASDIGIVGAQINRNTNAGTNASAFNHGHNLHKLTLTTSASITIPVFPPSC